MVQKRLSVIELYAERGLLDYVHGKWTTEYRLSAGLQLAKDFYLSGLQTVKAIDYSKDRVDTSYHGEPDYVLNARRRYGGAIRAIPTEFFNAVSDVCCHDKQLKGNGKNRADREKNKYLQVCDLCRGLDYLIQFYLKNHIRI